SQGAGFDGRFEIKHQIWFSSTRVQLHTQIRGHPSGPVPSEAGKYVTVSYDYSSSFKRRLNVVFITVPKISRMEKCIALRIKGARFFTGFYQGFEQRRRVPLRHNHVLVHVPQPGREKPTLCGFARAVRTFKSNQKPVILSLSKVNAVRRFEVQRLFY